MTAETHSVTIRAMTEADIDALAGSMGWPRHGIEGRYRELVDGTREVFVAHLHGNSVGSVSLNEHAEVPGVLHLFALDVAATYRGRGIGTALVATIEHEAARRQLDGVWLDVAIHNPDARRLYERLGYRREGPVVVNRRSYVDEQGVQRDSGEPCYRMFKRFDGGGSR